MSLRIIAGIFKGRPIQAPKTTSTRPTQGMLREAIFNICQMEIEGSHLLDLFAGSGAIGFEALSRGASHVTFVEKNRQAISCIQKNIETLDVKEKVTLLCLDAAQALKQIAKVDICYIDPPYDLPVAKILSDLLMQNIFNPGGIVFVEERYDPKKLENPFTSPKLLLKSSRKFGTALLHQYIIS